MLHEKRWISKRVITITITLHLILPLSHCITPNSMFSIIVNFSYPFHRIPNGAINVAGESRILSIIHGESRRRKHHCKVKPTPWFCWVYSRLLKASASGCASGKRKSKSKRSSHRRLFLLFPSDPLADKEISLSGLARKGLRIPQSSWQWGWVTSIIVL